ncbi:signal peptidase II [Planctomycetaceae bacterium]|nr:signal peptidase II [Planctomycetaceae bacterium]
MPEAAAAPKPNVLQSLFTHKLVFWYGILVVIVLDLATKVWAERVVRPVDPDKIEVIPGILAWKWAENLGAAFSIFHGRTDMLALIATGVTCAVIFYMFRTPRDRKWFLLALGLIAGGAVGNLHDRFMLGHVRDFILFDFDLPFHTWRPTFFWSDKPSAPIPQRWPIFNVADMAINAGVIVLLVISLFTKDDDKQAKKPEAN